MNKRDFVLASCAALSTGVALAAPLRLNAASTGNPMRRLARFPDLQSVSGLAAWRNYVGEPFFQVSSDGAQVLALKEVALRHTGARGEQFTLTFVAAHAIALPAGTRVLSHRPTGQQIPVFLQSAGTLADGRTLYLADFNLMV